MCNCLTCDGWIWCHAASVSPDFIRVVLLSLCSGVVKGYSGLYNALCSMTLRAAVLPGNLSDMRMHTIYPPQIISSQTSSVGGSNQLPKWKGCDTLNQGVINGQYYEDPSCGPGLADWTHIWPLLVQVRDFCLWRSHTQCTQWCSF